MTSQQLEPHSRWRLREKLDRLGESYDAAAEAIDAFARAAQDYDSHSAQPGAAARLRAAARRVAGSRCWPGTFWFAATLLLVGSFLAWISLAILRRFIPDPIPVALAAAPGVLVTLTLGGTAARLAHSPFPRRAGSSWETRSPQHETRTPTTAAGRAWPFAIALTGCAAWIAAWLIGVAGVAAWFAIGTAVLSASVTGAAFVAASQPAMRQAGRNLARARPAAPSRRLLASQQTAEQRLRRHAAQWSSATHAGGLAAAGSAPVEAALNQLLTTGTLGDMPVQDMDAFHTQMLTTLLRFQPDPLRARLRAASERLPPYPTQPIATPDRSTR
jgi:hypothetical protein